MSLYPSEARAIAAELTRELANASVQKVYAPTTTRAYLELRVPGRSVTVLLCAEVHAARLSAVDERPPNPLKPPGWQSVLRRELEGKRLVDAEPTVSGRLIALHFRDAPTLMLELTSPPGISLVTRERRILAQSAGSRTGLHVGGLWTPPDQSADAPDRPSRLAANQTHLGLAHAAEALFAAKELAATQLAYRAPLQARLKRLARTRDKVLADAARIADAQTFRRDGELLSRHVAQLRRGATSVTLTEYLDDGTTRERTIALDPKRNPQQEVDWRFHQYCRLTRGAELARKRLAQLDAEALELRTQLDAPPPSRADLAAKPPAPRAQERKARPYREYVGYGDGRIWVGKGSRHNDTLTFTLAKPNHLWLHARGVPGAHVVVPLDAEREVGSELLIDAAHLALHHSDAKGEPRGEVTYVAVKRVRKPRNAGPGAVVYTHEKTLSLRVEADRLARLLSTEQ